ncbi:Fpg/Nei family DNA glycosylase [Microbacterium sp. P02]|uniref:Fpg/Nei family DNA glycosylase n=1 Tax=Microbacterium sp. P02 TaxID=3366260 RepID=UPI00367186E7
MPESPEVQALAEFVSGTTVGRVIRNIDIRLPKALKTDATSVETVIGCRITGVVRHGKMLDVVLENEDAMRLHLVVHWGHDGWLLWHDTVPEGDRRCGEATLIARVRLDDGSGFDLTDDGQWKGLSVFVVTKVEDVPAIAKLGPDPLDPSFTVERLSGLLSGRRKQLKALLQDQTTVAGIGNAYSDEILHAARLSPVVHAAALTPDEVVRLHTAARAVLSEAAHARRGRPPEDLKDDKRATMRVHRRAGEPCPVCGDTIVEFAFSGAASQWCPTCQGGAGVPTP